MNVISQNSKKDRYFFSRKVRPGSPQKGHCLVYHNELQIATMFCFSLFGYCLSVLQKTLSENQRNLHIP